MERRLTENELAFLAMGDRGPDGRSTDIASGDGDAAVARRGCSATARAAGRRSRCASLPEENRERLACSACGFIAYVNPRLVVTTHPGHRRRARRSCCGGGSSPGVGWWAQPGGFLEVDETVHEAAVRETLEETGLLVEPGDLVGLYSRLEAAVVVVVFEASIAGGAARTTPEALEVRAFAPEAIPWGEIAFKTSYFALRDWVRRRAPDASVPADFREPAD